MEKKPCHLQHDILLTRLDIIEEFLTKFGFKFKEFVLSNDSFKCCNEKIPETSWKLLAELRRTLSEPSESPSLVPIQDDVSENDNETTMTNEDIDLNQEKLVICHLQDELDSAFTTNNEPSEGITVEHVVNGNITLREQSLNDITTDNVVRTKIPVSSLDTGVEHNMGQPSSSERKKTIMRKPRAAQAVYPCKRGCMTGFSSEEAVVEHENNEICGPRKKKCIKTKKQLDAVKKRVDEKQKVQCNRCGQLLFATGMKKHQQTARCLTRSGSRHTDPPTNQPREVTMEPSLPDESLTAGNMTQTINDSLLISGDPYECEKCNRRFKSRDEKIKCFGEHYM